MLPVVVAVPCTTYRPGRRIYPTHVLVRKTDGGLDMDSVVLTEQVRVLSKGRLRWLRGTLATGTMAQIDQALLIALDLPGQL